MRYGWSLVQYPPVNEITNKLHNSLFNSLTLIFLFVSCLLQLVQKVIHMSIIRGVAHQETTSPLTSCGHHHLLLLSQEPCTPLYHNMNELPLMGKERERGGRERGREGGRGRERERQGGREREGEREGERGSEREEGRREKEGGRR